MSSKETEGLLAGSVEQAYLENRSAGGKRRTEALGALQAMYVFQFCGSLAYGMWAVISPYFLEARGYSTVGAANMYTFAWVAYNVGQIIMSPIAGDIADGHGRRPVFLASAFVVTIFFLTFVYPAAWWWITGSFFQGAADVSWGLANAVVVDCVGQGVVPGGAEDWAPLRLFRAVATGLRHDTLDDNVRQELAVAMESVWILGGAGALVGSALAYPVWTYFNDGAAMAFPGLFYFTLFAFAYAYFPETRPDQAAAQRLDNPTAIAGAIRDGIASQAEAIPLVLRDRRAAWLVGSYFTLYVVMTGLLNIGIYWGQATFGWGIESGTVFTCLSIAAPFIGAVAASAALFPSSLPVWKSHLGRPTPSTRRRNLTHWLIPAQVLTLRAIRRAPSWNIDFGLRGRGLCRRLGRGAHIGAPRDGGLGRLPDAHGSADARGVRRPAGALARRALGDDLCGNQNFTARSRRPQRLLDGVAMPVPRRSTEPARPRHHREMT